MVFLFWSFSLIFYHQLYVCIFSYQFKFTPYHKQNLVRIYTFLQLYFSHLLKLEHLEMEISHYEKPSESKMTIINILLEYSIKEFILKGDHNLANSVELRILFPQ